MATVNVTHLADVPINGATVTDRPGRQDGAGYRNAPAQTTFQDLTAAKSYSFTADWIDQTDPGAPIHYTKTVTQVLKAGANVVNIAQVVVP